MTKKFDKLSLSDEKLQRIENNRQKDNTFLQAHIQTDRQTNKTNLKATCEGECLIHFSIVRKKETE